MFYTVCLRSKKGVIWYTPFLQNLKAHRYYTNTYIYIASGVRRRDTVPTTLLSQKRIYDGGGIDPIYNLP